MPLPRRLIRRVGRIPRSIVRSRHGCDLHPVVEPFGSRPGFDPFTNRARSVLRHAQDESRRLGHHYLGTEHILLGLLREREGVAARALAAMGVRLTDVRSAIESTIGRGTITPLGEIHMTPRAKRAVEHAIAEARRHKHQSIGTGHLLLGLLREGAGIAAQILARTGVTSDRARAEIRRILESSRNP